MVGVSLSLIVTLILGFSITRAARGHLLDARSETIRATVESLPPFSASQDSAELVAFDSAVRAQVLGGETIRFKVWDPNGTIVYSDSADLVGQRFDLPIHARLALEEGSEAHISDLSDPAHESDRGHGQLIEFYVAIPDASGSPEFVAEVEQDAGGLTQALSLIARNVWTSIGLGIMSIIVVVALGISARGREMNRKRREAEQLLQSSFVAQEQDRRRVVSALHDDIGQPLYRLLYGLEGAQSKLDPSTAVAQELGHLTTVVREMDSTLRRELRILNHEIAADVGLAAALGELVALTETESPDLIVSLSIELSAEPSNVGRNEIYRAAREAITNVRKHAMADHVQVRVYERDGTIMLTVIDNGVGFAVGTSDGLGLSTTKQRFQALDGGVTIERNRSRGTRFLAWLPENEEEPA